MKCSTKETDCKAEILLNGQPYPAEEVAAALGISKVKSVGVSVQIPDGELIANTCPGNKTPMEVLFASRDVIPRPIVEMEQFPSKLPRAYLFSNSDSYIAFTDIDTRSDEEFEAADDTDPAIVVGGGVCGETLHIYLEDNNFVIQPLPEDAQ